MRIRRRLGGLAILRSAPALGASPALEPMGPIRYVPERIRIEANEGFFEQAVSL
jgi:hypothetical protein